MKDSRKEARYQAYLNAAEMIRGHHEVGLTNEDVGCDLKLYVQEAKKLADRLNKLAEKYRLTPPII